MRIYLILLAALWSSLQIDAQRISLDRNQVIASSGLNLRSSPGTNSEVLTKIPFKATVKILSEELSNIDSTNFRHDAHLSGWVKVVYNSYIGFVSDDYLYFSSLGGKAGNYDFLGDNDDPKYCIQSTRQAAITHKAQAYQWMGILNSNERFHTKKVYPEYYYAPSEIQDNLGMRIPGSLQPDFLIGYAGDLLLPPASTIKFNSRVQSTYNEIKAVSATLLKELAIDTSDSSDINSSYLLDISDDISFKWIQAVGDFDGDGQTDFIATYQHKKYDVTNVYILFLTTEAEDNNRWKAVAACSEYYGC